MKKIIITIALLCASYFQLGAQESNNKEYVRVMPTKTDPIKSYITKINEYFDDTTLDAKVTPHEIVCKVLQETLRKEIELHPETYNATNLSESDKQSMSETLTSEFRNDKSNSIEFSVRLAPYLKSNMTVEEIERMILEFNTDVAERYRNNPDVSPEQITEGIRTYGGKAWNHYITALHTALAPSSEFMTGMTKAFLSYCAYRSILYIPGNDADYVRLFTSSMMSRYFSDLKATNPNIKISIEEANEIKTTLEKIYLKNYYNNDMLLLILKGMSKKERPSYSDLKKAFKAMSVYALPNACLNAIERSNIDVEEQNQIIDAWAKYIMQRPSYESLDSIAMQMLTDNSGYEVLKQSTDSVSIGKVIEVYGYDVLNQSTDSVRNTVDINKAVKDSNWVSVNASFPGGVEAFYDFLAKNIKYPDAAKEQGIQGRVFVSWVINTDGSVVDIKVMRSPDKTLSREALRLVSIMPKWIPAKLNEKPVRARFNCPIMFRLN